MTEIGITTMDDQNIKDFIHKSKKRLKTILGRLGWSEEDVFKNFNANKKVHIEDVVYREEPDFPENCATKNTIVIEKEELQKLVNNSTAQIPTKFSDLQANFTREQKLCIYEHVIKNTEKFTEPEMQVLALKEGQMTFAEIVAMKNRETKQRRRKYRTTKPTHIEEVRGLVELQMQALQQYQKGSNTTEHSKKHEKERRSRSRERRAYNDDKYHSHHKDRKDSCGSRNYINNYDSGFKRDNNRRMCRRSRSRSFSDNRIRNIKHKEPKRYRSTSRSRSRHKIAHHSKSRNDTEIKDHKARDRNRRSRSHSRNKSKQSKHRHDHKKHKRKRSRSKNRKHE